jgi:hypothetical protein
MDWRLISWRRLGASILVAVLVGLVTPGSAFAAPTRYEQTAPSIVYSGTWTTSGLPGHSGGSLAYSSQVNGTATFTFTGTGVDYIGAKWYNRGIAAISLDGGPEQMRDLYAPGVVGDTGTVQYQQVIWGLRGLPNGPHTLRVRVTGNNGGAASAPYLITVDAFDVFVEPPVVSTPASSPWSIALAAVGVFGLVVAANVLRRRKAVSRI